MKSSKPRLTAGIAPAVQWIAWTALLAFGCWRQLFAYANLRSLDYNDFARFYEAVRVWRGGGSLYEPNSATWFRPLGMHLWNLNPPHFSLIVWPLIYLPIGDAFGVWLWLNVGSMVASLLLAVRALHLRVSALQMYGIFAFVMAATPTVAFVATGNITGIVTLLVTVVWYQIRKGRWQVAAVAIGAAWSTKLMFAPLVLFLLFRRQWRPALTAILAGAAMFAIGLAVFGWSEHVAWIRVLRDVQWPWLVMNSSLFGPLSRAAYVATSGALTSPQAEAAVRAGLMIGGPLAVGSIWIASRDHAIDRAVLLVLLTCLLTFPVGWLYYWWMIGAPLIACKGERPIRIAFLCSLPAWLIASWHLWPTESVVWAVTIGSLYFWAIALLWAGTILAVSVDWRKAAIAASAHPCAA